MSIHADIDTLTDLYDQHMPEVFRFCYLKTGNRRLAEHLTSETFHRIVGQEATAVDINPGLWLICVARGVVTDYQQRWPDERAEVDLPADPGNLELIAVVWRLRSLYQDCLILRHLMNLSPTQTARAMSRTVSAIRVLDERATRALAAILPGEFVP